MSLSTEAGEKETSGEIEEAGEQEGNPPPVLMGNEQGKVDASSVVAIEEPLTSNTEQRPVPDAIERERPACDGDLGDHREIEEAPAPPLAESTAPSAERGCGDKEEATQAAAEADDNKSVVEKASCEEPGVGDEPAGENASEAEEAIVEKDKPATGDAGVVPKEEPKVNPESASILDCTVTRVENWATASDSPKHEITKREGDAPYGRNEEIADTSEKEKTDSKDGESDGPPQAALDEDENKNSPAYIPKVGNFYMHDVRGSEEKDDESKDAGKGKSRADRDKWRHDLFDERRQAPKSSKELVQRYGGSALGGSTAKEDEARGSEVDSPAVPVRRSNNLGQAKAPVSRVRGKGRPHPTAKATNRRVVGRRREGESDEDESEISEELAPPPRVDENPRREGQTKGRSAGGASAKATSGDEEVEAAPRRSIHSRITRINRSERDGGGGERELDRRPAYSPERNRTQGAPRRAPPPTVSENSRRRGGRGEARTPPPYSGAYRGGRRGVDAGSSRRRDDFYQADRGPRRMDRYDEDSPSAEYRPGPAGGRRYTSQRANYPADASHRGGPGPDRGYGYREARQARPDDDDYNDHGSGNNRRGYGQRDQGSRFPPPANTNYPPRGYVQQRGGYRNAQQYPNSTRGGYEDEEMRRPQYSSSRQPADYGQERHGSSRQQHSAQQSSQQYSQHQYHSQRTGPATPRHQTTHSYSHPSGGSGNASYQLAFPPLGAVAPSQPPSHQHYQHSHGQQAMRSGHQQQHPSRQQVQQQQNYQHPRQPTDAVYFDAQQQVSQEWEGTKQRPLPFTQIVVKANPHNPPPTREKRRLQITPET